MGNNATGGIVRTVLAAGAGYVVAKGWISESMANEIVGLLVVIITGAWSIWSKKAGEDKTTPSA